MIRINLLPTKRKKKAKPIPQFVVVGIILLVVSLAVSLYGMYFMNSKITALEEQKKANEKKLAELEKKRKEVERFEALNRTFQERKKIIEELSKNQSLPVRILDEVAKSLTEGVWLTGMNISRGVVNISGLGFSNSDIVTYVQNLKASDLFTDVTLHSTNRTNIDEVEVFNFSISFKVKA